MTHRALIWASLLLLFAGFTVTADANKASSSRPPTLFLIGDSTVKNGRGDGADGLWGWGDFIGAHFDRTKLKVENRALGGRSSRTYQTEGAWTNVLEDLQPGDFVTIQFGHNDAGSVTLNRARASLKGSGEESVRFASEATGETEVVHTYGWYLRKYVADAKGKGATPIILSPVPRNLWQDGKVARAANDYGKWAAEAAKADGAPFIDLNEIIARRYETEGQTNVASVYFTAADHTHTTRTGAQVNAACVVEGIQQNKLGLVKFLAEGAGALDPARPGTAKKSAVPPSPATKEVR